MSTTASRTGLPLRPDPSARREAALSSIVRAAIALAEQSLIRDGRIDAVLHARGWGDDRLTALLTRTASGPAFTSQAGWAAEFATVAQAFLQALQPFSAAASLLAACASLSFDGVAKILLPVMTPVTAAFVSEGSPIRVGTMPIEAGPELLPFKLATICEFSNEMMNSSNIETLARQALLMSIAPALDAALFDSSAGTPGLRPPGLLAGLTPIAPSASTSKVDAMDDDISKLVAAIGAYAGNSDIAIVAAPAQATRLLMRAARTPGAVYMSSALADKTVMALATAAIAASVGAPIIDASKHATLHRDDSAPAPIVGSGGQVAVPVGSIFQNDGAAIRLRMPVSWVRRKSAAVAVVNNTVW